LRCYFKDITTAIEGERETEAAFIPQKISDCLKKQIRFSPVQMTRPQR